MKATRSDMLESAVLQYCKILRIPTVSKNFRPWAEQAIKENQSHVEYLEALLGNEVIEQEQHTIQRRMREAQFPRVKTLEDFDFQKNARISAPLIRRLAEGDYLKSAEPVIFIGDCGTGKTHLMTGLGVAACRQKQRVRFTTAATLVTELSEAQKNNHLGRAMAKWRKFDLLAIDEVGYVPFGETNAELFFQVITERNERTTVILTTNLPFSEWTKVFPNPRLCKALLDRLTDRAHIIETGEESYRFKRTMDLQRQRKGSGRP